MVGSAQNNLKFASDPPAYAASAEPPLATYSGPLRPGKYWLGQPDEQTWPKAREAPSTAALSANTRYPLRGDSTASTHLSAIGNGPWPNQIWTLESGHRGYRLRNEATESCLNYVNGAPVLEAYTTDTSLHSNTEWVLHTVAVNGPNDLPSFIVRPRANEGVWLGATKGGNFNKCHMVSQSSFFWGKWVYGEWRFEPVPEDLV